MADAQNLPTRARPFKFAADRLARFGLPPLTLATAVAGAFLTYDWKAAATAHPGLATLMIWMDAWIGPLFFVIAIAGFLIALLQSVVRPSLSALQSKVDLVGESLKTLCDGLMSDLATKLGVGNNDQTRVSLYIHDGDRRFVLLGRFSPNPLLRKPGRPDYPDDQGCIAKGWQHGWWFENGLGAGAQYVRNTENRYGIPAAELDKLPMKSRLFGVHRIDCSGEATALVVVESMRQDRFIAQPLEATLKQFSIDYAPIIEAFRNYAPMPSIAARSGL